MLSLPSAASPVLFTAVMVMLLSANAKRLMLGYLLGAYTTSITLGLVILFALPESTAVSTSRKTISPVVGVAIGVLALVMAAVLHTGPHDRAQGRRERRKEAREKKGPPRWRRTLDKGSPRASFAVGMALSLPGASYLLALDFLHKQHLGTAVSVLCVVVYCMIATLLLELPLLGYIFAPDWTIRTVEGFQSWAERDGRKVATVVAFLAGIVLLVRGAIEFLS